MTRETGFTKCCGFTCHKNIYTTLIAMMKNKLLIKLGKCFNKNDESKNKDNIRRNLTS